MVGFLMVFRVLLCAFPHIFFKVHVISAKFIASSFLITKNSTTNLEMKVIVNTCSSTLKSSLDRVLCSFPASFCDLLNTHKAHTSISHLVIKKY